MFLLKVRYFLINFMCSELLENKIHDDDDDDNDNTTTSVTLEEIPVFPFKQFVFPSFFFLIF